MRDTSELRDSGLGRAGREGAQRLAVADTVNRRVHMPVAFTFVCECRFCRASSAR